MPELIGSPVRVEAAGEPPKVIEEFAGRASNGEERASVARNGASPDDRPDEKAPPARLAVAGEGT